MKHHCRCRVCLHRHKLRMQPKHYRRQPRCSQCGARDWRRDDYRHKVELPQIRMHAGRYRVCHADCHPHPHRVASNGCKFDERFEYRPIGQLPGGQYFTDDGMLMNADGTRSIFDDVDK